MVRCIPFLRLAALASLVALSLAACRSGSTSGAGDEQPLTVAAVRSATQAEGTAHVVFLFRQTTTGIPHQPDQSLEISAEGVVDIDADRGRFRLDISGVDIPREEQLQQTGDLVVDGDTGYVRSSSADAATGEKWQQLPPGSDLSGLGSAAIDAPFVTGMGLSVFGLGEPSDVEDLGREDVRGTSASHYRVTVEPSEDDVEDVRLRAALADGKPFVYDVWVDDADRMRRMSYRVDLTASSKKFVEDYMSRSDGTTTTFPAGLSIVAEVAIEVWGFGESVDIEVPPPDQVTPDS